MGKKVIEVRQAGDSKLLGWRIWCPACKTEHFFELGPRIRNGVVKGPGWSFDGNFDAPTFTPSMNISWGPFPEDSNRAGQYDRCHSVITAGRIAYCADSTHALSGQTVDLPDFPLGYD